MLSDAFKYEFRRRILGWHGQLMKPLLPPETVWHYTKGESLIKIIDSGSLFSTQAACLNDSTELRYATSLLRKTLSNFIMESGVDAEARSFCVRYIELLTDNDNEPQTAGSMFFMTCFSLLKDDLNQWRSYGGGENGYALGFTPHDLIYEKINQQRMVGRVNYDALTHLRIAREVSEFMVTSYKEARSSNPLPERDEWESALLSLWDQELVWLTPFVKNPGFASEQEVRVVRAFQEEDLANLVFLQRKTLLSRHLPLRWPKDETTSLERIPLRHIIVGPGRHKHISAVSVKTLLNSRGYKDSLVAVSEIPYQEA